MSRLCLIACLAVAASPLCGQAVDRDSARAAAIIARHDAAMRGQTSVHAYLSRHMVSTMTTATGPGVNAPVIRAELYTLAPNMIYVKTVSQIGEMEMGFDGTTAWSNSPGEGAVILPKPPNVYALLASSDSTSFRNARSTFVGRRELEGKTYDVVRVTLPDSQISLSYYDSETGLMARTEISGPTPAVMTYHDYRPFDGILFATRMVIRTGETEMIQRLESVDHRPIDRRLFAPPANAIRAPR